MSDFDIRLNEARKKLPLRDVISQAGKAPQNNNWKSFSKCPFCGETGAGVYTPKSDASSERFHCHHVPCPSGNKDLDEIGFIALDRGLSRDDAWKVYFKEAGVWKEERLAPSVLPGSSRRRPKQEINLSEGEDEALIVECIEVIRSEQRASVSLLQRRLRLGYTRASRIIDVLEKRGIVGPSKGSEPREVLLDQGSPESRPTGEERENNLPGAEPIVGETTTGLDIPLTGESGENAGAPGVPPTQPVQDPPRVEEGGSGSAEPSTAAPSISDKRLAQASGEGKIIQLPLPPAPPVAPPPAGEPPSPAVAALRWFYERLILVLSDRKLLWEKRGQHDVTVDALGYRSNLKSNKEILLEMPKHFPLNILMDCGLWTQAERPGELPKPNPQYYGMSLVEKRDPQTGKKVRDRDGDPIVECVWGDPGAILIPYFDTRGELVHLRPHKGMMKGRMPRFYVARPSAKFLAENPTWKPGPVAAAALPGITMAKPLFSDIEEWLEETRAIYAVITEGEFKAGALWQVLNSGDLQAEYPPVRQVIVGYDNEDKSDPELPGYQEDKWKRYDAQIWARYLARQIGKEGYDARVCHLPDEWRDVKGKADWDGRLAFRLDRLQALEYPDWLKHAALLRAEFEMVIKAAMPVHELWQAQLFDTEEERIIKNGLERISYERMLPVGGEDEENIARRLQRLIPRLRRAGSIPPKAINFLALLAKRYQDLKGGYYIYKKLTEKLQADWEGYLNRASEDSDSDLKRACELVLRAGVKKTGGMPERISDFYMKAHYCLVKTTGARIRLVSLHNIHGVRTKTVQMPSEAFAQPSKFREWLLNSISGATWLAGERELQAMQADIAKDLSFKEVNEVAVRCHHAESKCWFYGDSLYLPDGTEIARGQDTPKGKWDKDDIIWVKMDGKLTDAYKLSATDHEDQNFCHELPMMHPSVKITDEELREFFKTTSEAFLDTLGGGAGWLVMGVMFSCYANPEIYREFTAQSGLWLHGETRQGKSSVARWAMKILGYATDKGMPLQDSTKVGLSIALQQYGDSCVWLEEFQPGAPVWQIEKIKNIHGREAGIKKTFDEGRREIRSMALITGVATCSDAQVKSRYVHVQVAEKNRKRNCFEWFQENSKRFYVFGRHILRNRQQFAKRTVEIMKEWVNDKTIVGVDSRARIVYGAAYAAFVAFNELVGAYNADTLYDFRESVVQAASASVKEVTDQVNVNHIWRLTLDALVSGAFGETPAERRRVFKAVVDMKPRCNISEYQTQVAGDHGDTYLFPHVKLYFRPSPWIDMLYSHLRKQGKTPPLEQQDLLHQMQTRPYWVSPTNTKRGHQQLFEGDSSKRYCWCIHLDLHEMGYVQVSDEEFKASLHYDEGPHAGRDDVWLPREAWVDPRKGDLFAIVESLISKRETPSDQYADANAK